MNWFWPRNRKPVKSDTPAPVAGVQCIGGYCFQLDERGWVVDASPELGRLLAEDALLVPAPFASHLVQPAAEIKGVPETWPAQLSSLVLRGRNGRLVYFQGGLMPHGEGWLLFLLDNTEMVRRLKYEDRRAQVLDYSVKQAMHMREAPPDQARELTLEWLEGVRIRVNAPWLGLLLPSGHGWSLYADACLSGAEPFPWDDANLQAVLQNAANAAPQTWSCKVSGKIAWLVPYREHDGVRVWLVGQGIDTREVPAFSGSDWLKILMLFAAPLSSGVRYLQVQQSLQRNSVLQRVMDIGWWEFDPATQRVSMAPNLAATMGFELGFQSDISLEEALSVFDQLDRQEAMDRLAEVVTQNEPFHEPVLLNTSNGRNWYRLIGEVVGNRQRKVIGYAMNISDLREQEAQTAAAKARLEGLLNNAPAVIFIQSYVGGALNFEYCSASLYQLLGWTLSDLQHNAFSSFLHPEDRKLYFERTRTLLQTGYTSSRYRVRDCHGSYHWLLDEAKLLRDEQGIPLEVVGLLMDVTEATEASESVRKSEERYRILVEDSPAIICRYRPDLTLTFANQHMAAALGLDAAEVEGINIGQFLSEDDRAAVLRRLARMTPGAPMSNREVCLQLPGNRRAWWVWAQRGIFDDYGRLIEVQAISRDDTAIHDAREQLYQGAKMATLGEMATGLAHEMNQPLTVMRMALTNLVKRLANDDLNLDYLKDKLQRLESQVNRASKIVDHVRIFGRRSEVKGVLFDPGEAVVEAVSLVSEGMELKDIRLETELSTVSAVNGHKDRLEQVLINLLLNAQYAVTQRAAREPDSPRWVFVHCWEDNKSVFITVEDSGGGISDVSPDRIFEPFVTTKPVGEGTGLGLSVSYGIITQMRGQLSVESSDKGACFLLTLPIGDNPPADSLDVQDSYDISISE